MKVSDIQKVACLGGGVIGSSWAIQFAMHGLEVALRDVNDEQLEKSRGQMVTSLDALVEAGVMTPAGKEGVLSRVKLTTSVEEAVTGAGLVQENGPERLEIKQAILAEAEPFLAEDALYASSTSALSISDIARLAAHPERCVGAHPYNPPHLIPLVELTRGEKTSEEAVTLAYDFYQSVGKEAVLLKKECPGFISNRLQLALYREMVDLVRKGVCSVTDADKALVYGPGLRWAFLGQFMLMELGSTGGFMGMMNMLQKNGNAMLPGMANWTSMPEDWSEFNAGVQEELAALPDWVGHTAADCAAYRDKALIEALKLHKKLG